MKAWWGRLSLQGRLAVAFGALAAGGLLFLLAIIARTLGTESLVQGKILPATLAVLMAFFFGGWFVAGWCLQEISRLGTRISAKASHPLPAELEGLAALLRREAQKHDRLMAELRRFTADAAHELRKPLTALRTLGEVALRQPGEVATSREAIASMLEEAQRMDALITQLLRLARLESDAYPVHWRTVRLLPHLTTACDGLSALAEEKQVRLLVRCREDLEATADVTLLLHAVMNLLDNAIRHSPSGGTVTVWARHEEKGVVIEVSDEGPGIAPEHQARLFQRFYRVERPGTRAAGGFGLGLYIAKTAIERMNGRLGLRSTPGQGATFRIELPVAGT